jgi:hypothetical protein
MIRLYDDLGRMEKKLFVAFFKIVILVGRN